MKTIKDYREFLKGDLWDNFDELESGYKKKKPAPPLQKPYPHDSKLIDLIPPDKFTIGNVPLIELISKRKSEREYLQDPLSLEELSFLLWATQGKRDDSGRFRNVPSAGARHPFETYLIIKNVEELDPGLYRYLPLDHKLLFIRSDEEFNRKLESYLEEEFYIDSAVIFFWTAIPYRSEWYYNIISHKMIAIDAGHVCQNLYLACGAIQSGTCGVAAYYHKIVDDLIGVDGVDEFTVYLAPVGKIPF